MNKENLEKKKKEELIEIILKQENEKEKLEDEVYTLRGEMIKTKFHEYIYEDYIEVRKQIEEERYKNDMNCAKINQLEELLERYKNIVDKLGGSKYID